MTTCLACPHPRSCRAAQGRGLGTAAARAAIELLFEHTPVQQIIAITDARNAPSMRLLDRVGMTRVATQTAVFRGEPCTEHRYSLTRARQRG
jgi:RimJ/RimL family protein N-acetyltransferase